MSTVKTGDTVKVHYTGKYDTGDIFDTSEGQEPMGFTVGTGQVIPGFDQALIGMAVGESKEIVVSPENGYGERIEEQVQTISRDEFNISGFEPEEGMALELNTPQGNIPLIITDVTETTVTLDANHPLAGEELHFVITLVEIAN